jgi:histidinol-phosphate aminotransferase
MKLNFSTKFWLKQQTSSYLNKVLDTSNFVRFDMGECQLGKNQQEFAEYPEVNAVKLKKAIAKSERIKSNMVTVGCGADELIENLPRLLLNPGDKSIVITPTFFRFVEACQRQAVKIIEIPLVQKNNFNFDSQISQLVIKKSQKLNAKLIWLCSPNNPTGKIIDPSLITKIVKKSASFVVIDEVFNGFLKPKLANANLNLVKSSKNAMLLRSLSKAHGLAGIRIGWGIAHPETIELFEKWRLPFNIPTLSQKIACQTLLTNNLSQIRNKVIKERSFLEKEISKLPNLEICPGSQTNIFILRHKNKDLFEELLKRKILAADLRRSQGLKNKNFVRITIQNRKSNLQLLSVLKNI